MSPKGKYLLLSFSLWCFFFVPILFVLHIYLFFHWTLFIFIFFLINFSYNSYQKRVLTLNCLLFYFFHFAITATNFIKCYIDSVLKIDKYSWQMKFNLVLLVCVLCALFLCIQAFKIVPLKSCEICFIWYACWMLNLYNCTVYYS